MTYIISPEKVAQWLEDKQTDVVMVDVRADLHDEQYGVNAYEKNHLPEAHFLHLEEDLSGDVKKHGGNHPIPDVETFARKLGERGISNETKVVVYDDAVNMFAPRAWFLLRYVGVQEVYVLDGGYEGWKRAGLPITDELPEVESVTFYPKVQDEVIVSMEEVKNRATDVILIDSRAKERYLGLEEPLYDRAGHIPGAVNYCWQEVIGKDGKWKSKAALREHFAALPKDKKVIVSCGSGVSACANLLALHRIGYDHIVFYAGSFSDWISYEDNIVITDDESSL